MKKILVSIGLVLGVLMHSHAQRISDNGVKYMVSFDAEKRLYTAWLVPNYDTPNSNNPDTEEKGATAQFSLKVPKGFVISQVENLKGGWDTQPTKLGSEDAFQKAGVDGNYEYYIIGKSPVETNYGTFKAGEPVALFTFKGNINANQEKVGVLENTDNFVRIAENTLSLNVASSFYSRSGQAARVDAMPLEQFNKTTQLSEVIKEMTQRLTHEQLSVASELKPEQLVIAYPNPISEEVNIKYFATKEGDKTEISLIKADGTVLQQQKLSTHLGFNTVKLKLNDVADGTYFIKTQVGNQLITKKIAKMQE